MGLHYGNIASSKHRRHNRIEMQLSFSMCFVHLNSGKFSRTIDWEFSVLRKLVVFDLIL